VAGLLGAHYRVEVLPCESEVGSGAAPNETLRSTALAIRPAADRGAGRALKALAARLRGLPVPVIGRIAEDALWLDLRCLADEAGFLANFATAGASA
jgi:L-seryl-tRNA(Ser) seleniumtransferase